MRSKSFETQEVREIGRKKAGESRGFFILWMGLIRDVLQMEEKECEVLFYTLRSLAVSELITFLPCREFLT